MTSMIKHACLFTSLLTVACGGGGESTNPDGNTGDGGVDGPQAPPKAIIVSGTFQAGEPGQLAVFDVTTQTMMKNAAPAGAIGDDPIVRKVGNELFVVNRADTSNVTILDLETLAVKEQISTGVGSNPQDIAVHGNKLFVPAMGTKGVVVLTRGSTAITTTIDLSSLDPDLKPDCVSAYTIGDEIYVACGLLDGSFEARGSGELVIIDANTNAVKTESVTFGNRNPLGLFEQVEGGFLNGDIIMPMVPNFGDFTTGCVERIKVGANPAAAGCVVTNSTLQGYGGRNAFQTMDGAAIQWLVVSSFDVQNNKPIGKLQGYDLENREAWPSPTSKTDQVISDVAVCPDGTVLAGDKNVAKHGLRIFKNAVETTTDPLDTGLNPASPRGIICY